MKIKKINFKINDLKIELVKPQIEHATDLYQAIKHDQKNLSKWLPWAYDINSIQAEANFIKQIQKKEEIIALTILVNEKASGMIDLHHITPNKRGEIGYWLSSSYQAHGIVTQSVLAVCEYAFNELNLQYIDLKINVQNDKSIAIAKRTEFKLMGNIDNILFFRKIK